VTSVYKVIARLEADLVAEDESDAVEQMADLVRESKPKEFDYEAKELHEPEENEP